MSFLHKYPYFVLYYPTCIYYSLFFLTESEISLCVRVKGAACATNSAPHTWTLPEDMTLKVGQDVEIFKVTHPHEYITHLLSAPSIQTSLFYFYFFYCLPGKVLQKTGGHPTPTMK